MIGKVLFSLAFLASTLPATAATRAFDDLFEGFDNGCQYSEAFNALLTSAYEFARKRGPFEPPAGYADSVATPIVKPDQGYLQVRVPLDGTWRGVPLQAIEIYMNVEESGFAYHAVIFDPSARKAASTAFKARGAKAQKKLAAENPEWPEWFTGYDQKNDARFHCDQST